MLYVLSNSSVDPATASLEIENSTQTINYLPYANQELGISFEYPSDWKVSEKTSRFSNDPDVTVSNGLNSFKYLRDKAGAGDSDFLDLDFMATMAQSQLTKEPDNRLIESVDLDKYRIDGKDTATFLVKTEKPFGENSFLSLDYATQIFIIDTGDRFDTIMYQDTVSRFDTPESQEKLNHMLNSFKFINSEDNIETQDSEGNDEEDS